MEGIEKLKRQEIEARTEYMAASKDLSDMEQQLEMMQQYLSADYVNRTKSLHSHEHERHESER